MWYQTNVNKILKKIVFILFENVHQTNLASFYVLRPQDGCLQYFTGLSGEFKTFNFDESSSSEYSHLASQE